MMQRLKRNLLICFTFIAYTFSSPSYEFQNFRDDSSSVIVRDTNQNSNSSTIYFGAFVSSSRTLSGNDGFSFQTSSTTRDALGTSICTGDFDKDGIDDVVSGAPYGSDFTGSVYILFGTKSPFNGNISSHGGTNRMTFIVGWEALGYMGTSVSCGDINRDGFMDVIIGSPSVERNGRVYVVFGHRFPGSIFSVNSLDGTNGFSVSAPAYASTFGKTVCACDVNGDGYADVLMSATQKISGVFSPAGYVFSIFGSDGPFQGFYNASEFDSSSFSVVGLISWRKTAFGCGDVNGDGTSDLLVSDSTEMTGEYGYVHVIYGSKQLSGAVNASTLNGENGFITTDGDAFSKFGNAIALGDINADGLLDIMIGAPDHNRVDYSQEGLVYIIFGSHDKFPANMNLSAMPSYTDGTKGFTVIGSYFSRFGESMAVGDVNGDTITDLLVAGPNGPNDGQVVAILGSRSYSLRRPSDITTLQRDQGFFISGDYSITFPIAVGDINGDGIKDVIYGNNGQSIVYVIFWAHPNILNNGSVVNTTGPDGHTIGNGNTTVNGTSPEEVWGTNTTCPVGTTNYANCTNGVVILHSDQNCNFFGDFLFRLPKEFNSSYSVSLKLKIGGDFQANNATWRFSLISKNLGAPDLELFNTITIVSKDWFMVEISISQVSAYVDNSTNALTIRVTSNATKCSSGSDIYVDTLELTYVSNPKSSSSKKNNLVLILAIVIPICALLLIGGIVAVVIIVIRRKNNQKLKTSRQSFHLSSIKTTDSAKQITGCEIIKRIGAGNFGVVYLGTAYDKTTKVAMKSIREDLYQDFMAEAEITNSLRHPNCVYFMGLYEDPDSHERYIVTEFCENGSLLEYLKSNKNKFTYQDLLKFAYEASKGMAYLEDHNIVHRDLACRNLLVTDKIHIKVADFGLSRTILEEHRDDNIPGGILPIRWTAPEALEFKRFSSKSDSWSMGITLFEIITCGEVPLAHLNNQEVTEFVCKSNLPVLNVPESCPDEYWSIVKDCLNRNPKDRPTLSEISRRLGALHSDDSSGSSSRSSSGSKSSSEGSLISF